MKLVCAAIAISVSAGLATAMPSPLAAQSGSAVALSARSSASSRLPTLELVGSFDCLGCVALAAGPGNTFAALSTNERVVRVWDLESGSATEFALTPRADGGLLRPVGLSVGGESILVAGDMGRDRVAEQYSLDGKQMGKAFLGTSDFASLTSYEAAPSGVWILQRLLDREGNIYTAVRANPSSGASEMLDVPATLLNRDPTLGRSGSSTSIAISDDGTVAMGLGKGASYWLVLVPGDGSPTIERERSLPLRPLTRGQNEAIQRTLSRVRLPGSPARDSFSEPTSTSTLGIPGLREQFQRGALQFDAKGRLWANTIRGTIDAPTTAFDLFSSAFEYLGTIELDEPIDGLYRIGSELLAARVRREQSQTVKVWRIREP